ncbi:MAG: hypothetical protein H5T86_05000 [Armatimonadetes bacterium]|nr:hypothetical protein [Armatimonadota bacterium]
MPVDTDGQPDVSVHDCQRRELKRARVAIGGGEANGGATKPCISPGGRIVALIGSGDQAVPGHTNGRAQGFLQHRQIRETRRISVSGSGVRHVVTGLA